MNYLKSIVNICLFVVCSIAFSQQETEAVSRTGNSSFIIVGSVLDTEHMKPVGGVNVEITGGAYTITSRDGTFRIRGKIGDELVIRGENFTPVYYTIKDRQRIRLEVTSSKESASNKKTRAQNSYTQLLSEAKRIYKNDAAQAIDKIIEALSKTTISKSQRAESFRLLGDIYSYWKQYDLAVSNYKNSIENLPAIPVEILLAKALYANKNYQESIRLYLKLSRKDISPEQSVKIKEGLGDAYVATGDYVSSITNYTAVEKDVSKRKKISEAARLNTKLGAVYEQQGSPQQAATYFNEAAALSNRETSEVSIRAKAKVADFYSKNNSFDAEIQLRQSALEDLKEIAVDSISNDDNITVQKQNYKIGNALAAQKKLEEAIPYFEKSIEEAVTKEDLIVEKDARRRLSEVFRDNGEFEKAATAYEAYKEVVDLSYNRKEQEISQATRFGKEIAAKQNRIMSLEKDRLLNESKYQLYTQEQELVKARDMRQRLIIGSLAVIAVLLLLTAFSMYRSNKQQKLANNILALKGLRSQMNPHFIFNALNSVNSFIATNDERTANKYLSDFSILMRAVLENSEEDFIPLSNELELIKRYTMLEHFRFKDKFDYTITIDENMNLDDFLIPPMLLQPYVENAIWHGLRYKEKKGNLQIDFKQKDEETAVIRVTDDGVGRLQSKLLKTDHQKKQKSKGMGNIKKRIAILNDMYGNTINVSITDAFKNGEGTKVALTLKKRN
ncbi:histidine kinase [Dokdonia sp. Hel_I_53]|uniref:histidine kinase n=1 Tax=Dokdonia sp. Hel_I_53 TaxID=1566287 RepID=UPI0021BD6928|nr:histidine kinase [Dokdonia sp. Hel_I_53]